LGNQRIETFLPGVYELCPLIRGDSSFLESYHHTKFAERPRCLKEIANNPMLADIQQQLLLCYSSK
jgi:hypothetical protein